MALNTVDFIDALIDNNYTHLCVVPCSFAKNVINEAINNKIDPLILDSDIKLNYLASFVSITFRPLYMPVLRSI